jgi:hypothetical protein
VYGVSRRAVTGFLTCSVSVNVYAITAVVLSREEGGKVKVPV